MPDSDADRRRAVALAGHQGDERAARAGLDDESPHVRATALGALTRIGVLSIADLDRGAADPDAIVRRRVAEVAPHAPDAAGALRVLRALLHDSEASVVEVAAWACGEVGAVAGKVVHELNEIATAHDDALAREAAVAALGAIGHEDGLPAILRATGDKPAIRRRAVLALAPFEGPEVEAALERARHDRDWQVRQAAEDLLTE